MSRGRAMFGVGPGALVRDVLSSASRRQISAIG